MGKANIDKTKEVYNFIRDYMLQHQYSPTIREICAGTSMSSTSSIFYQLEKLELKGLISKSPGGYGLELKGYKLVRDDSVVINEI